MLGISIRTEACLLDESKTGHMDSRGEDEGGDKSGDVDSAHSSGLLGKF